MSVSKGHAEREEGRGKRTREIPQDHFLSLSVQKSESSFLQCREREREREKERKKEKRK